MAVFPGRRSVRIALGRSPGAHHLGDFDAAARAAAERAGEAWEKRKAAVPRLALLERNVAQCKAAGW